MGLGILLRSSANAAVEHPFKRAFPALAALLCSLIAACGGGGARQSTPPSSLVYPQAAVTATAGTAIQPDTPTVMGTVSSYTVNPALPAGLSLNASTGAISGMPTAVTATATYTVTATNASGSTAATLTITVNPAAPTNLAYPQTTISAEAGVAIQADTPTVTGTVSSYAVSPALPAGLSLDASAGTISGTPTVAAAQASYVVTASNVSGSTTATVTITVSLSPPSNLVYPVTSIIAESNVAIQPDTPTVTGTVSSYTMLAPLPAGLSLDPSTGTISGTPTVTLGRSTFHVEASNASGSTTATIFIAIGLGPPANLTYAQPSISGPASTSIQPDVPTVSGSVVSYTVSPVLPEGLALDSKTGIISGILATQSTQTSYTVTAANGEGNTSTQVSITVTQASTVLFELGHSAPIFGLAETSDRVFSEDSTGHWILWDYNADSIITSGDGGTADTASHVAMAGQVAALNITTGIQVLSSSDGDLSFTIPLTAGWWQLASDGSYICVGTSTGLTVWTPSGDQEFTLPGNYLSAQAYSAPGQIQIALGPSGNTAIQTVLVPDGASSIGPTFSGSFASWFPDGQRFLSNAGSTVWVYSNATVQQGLLTVPPMPVSLGHMGGIGNWVWSISEDPLDEFIMTVYAVGSTTPTTTFTVPEESSYTAVGTTLALSSSASQITLIDFSGSTPVMTTDSTQLAGSSPFAAASSSQWVVGSGDGVILDGASLSTTPRYFGYGSAFSFAGAGNLVAFTVSTGQIFLFDVTGPTQEGKIDFLGGNLQITSDGSILAGDDGVSLNLYSLPSMSLMESFPAPLNGDYDLSASGTTLGQVLADSREVTGITGSPLIWSDTGVTEPIRLSPDGTLIAVETLDLVDGTAAIEQTNIYKNGTFVTTVSGYAAGWIDNNRLLVLNLNEDQATLFTDYQGASIYDASGTLLATYNGRQLTSPNDGLNQMFVSQFPTPNTLYHPAANAMYSLTTGEVIWQEPGGPGTASASYVVCQVGHQVVLYPY